MGKPLEQVAQEVVQLPGHQRLALAGLILALDEGDPDLEAEAALEKEIQARIRAIDTGMTPGVAREDVMRAAEASAFAPAKPRSGISSARMPTTIA